MSGDGENILIALRQIRDLHDSISMLLRTADAAMAEQGWKNAKSDSRALHEMSSAISRPDSWMPWDVFRFYRHSSEPSFLASISVLLDDTEDRLTEPLLSAALFDFGKGRIVDDFYYWLCGIYKAMPDREPDGQFREATMAQLDPAWRSDVAHVWCLTCPLVDVRSESHLRNEIVQKLCGKAQELHSR